MKAYDEGVHQWGCMGTLGAKEAAAAATSLFGFSIAVEHPLLSSNPRILCSAACACRAWRETVQQCAARNTAVEFDLRSDAVDFDAEAKKRLSGFPDRLRSFQQWLRRHAALVKSITATAGEVPPWQPWESYIETDQQLLQQALQAAAEEADAGAAGAAAAAAALPASSGAVPNNSTKQQKQQQQLGWRLASFSSDLPDAPALLSVLPSCSLTHLHLDLQHDTAAERASAELSQLTRLSSLQQLDLESGHSGCELPGSCLAGLAQLSQLTTLKLDMLEGVAQQLQQLLVQPLPLQQLQLRTPLSGDTISAGVDAALPSLANLTQLTELCLGSEIEHLGVALPAQLQSLYLCHCRDLAPVLALKQLQRLTVCPDLSAQHRVLELAQLPALQELHLRLSDEVSEKGASYTAPMWALLPQLRGLDLKMRRMFASSKQHKEAVLAGVAAATQLTSLRLEFASADVNAAVRRSHAMPVCGSLTRLGGLRELELEAASLIPGDALALTVLTGLMSLTLSNMLNDLGDVVSLEVTALARSLKHLEYLNLWRCGVDLGSTAFLAAVCQLKQMEHLCLEGNAGLTQQGLMLLTGLPCLQELHVDRDEEVTQQVLDGFMAAVQRQ